MNKDIQNKFIIRAVNALTTEFGEPTRTTAKVMAWNICNDLGVVIQIDQPNREQLAYIWLPYPSDGQSIPEIALEYPGEAGRHSNTYASPGLGRGLPALKLFVHSDTELNNSITFIKAFRDSLPLPEIKQDYLENKSSNLVNPSQMPAIKGQVERRQAIPRLVQREVWQRDGGHCVECGTKEKLCFDHIVPFSRGGNNTIRNLQLLCERCNLSKGNRI